MIFLVVSFSAVVVVVIIVVDVVVVVVVLVLTLTRIIKSLVTGQAPAILELRNTLGKTQTTQRWYTLVSQLTQCMNPPETYNSKIGSQPTIRQVHSGAYASLLPTETLTIPLATQQGPLRIYYTSYLSLRIRTTDASQMEKRNKE